MAVPEKAGGQGEKGESNHKDFIIYSVHSEGKSIRRKGNNQNIKRTLIFFFKCVYLLTRSLLSKRRSCNQTF